MAARASKKAGRARKAPNKVRETQVAYEVPPPISVIETAVTRLSTKNQITLPVAIVRMLGLKPGDEIGLLAMDGEVYLKKQLRGKELLDQLRGSMAHVPQWSTREAVDEYVRNERDSWKRPWDPE